jgi:hypothetical protein
VNADKAKRIVMRPFSEARYQEIKASLAERDVDLDACTVGLFVPDKARWWLVDDSDAQTKEPPGCIEVDGAIEIPRARQQSLRDALQFIAWYYSTPVDRREKPLTAAQMAKGWQETRKAFEDACVKFERTAINHPCYSQEDWAADSIMYDAVTEFIDRQQERIAKLKVVGRTGNQNARTRHNDYWRELTRLWLGITGSAGSKRRQRLLSFLRACTPPTMFPGMTARQLTKKLDTFVNNCFR